MKKITQNYDSPIMLERTRHICEAAAENDGTLREFMTNPKLGTSNKYISLYNRCKEVHKFAWDFVVLICSGDENFYSLAKALEMPMAELYELRYQVRNNVLNLVRMYEKAV